MKMYDKLAMPMQLKTVSKKDITQKKVLVRVDFNVPLKKNTQTGNLEVVNDARIQASLETILFLLENQAQVILMGHLGRPQGRPEAKYSFTPVAHHLSKALKIDVPVITDYIDIVPDLPQISILENLRFHPGEKQNNPTFCKKLAKLADVYVNEAFSTSHRNHASIEGITHFLPSFAGLGLTKEVTALNKLINAPQRPFVMMVGGAKISDKIAAISNLAQIADTILVGGGVANNFLKADGFDIAQSYLEDIPADKQKERVDFVQFADDLLDDNKQEHTILNGYFPLPKIIYPIDVVVAKRMESKESRTINLLDKDDKNSQIKKTDMYLDIGPRTIKLFSEVIKNAKTIFWNGPMGVFEQPQFAKGTKKIARAIADSKATSIIGGGDTIAAINALGLSQSYSYVSAAGGAALAFLSGKTLPGIKPLIKN